MIRERSFLDLLDLALLVVRDRPVILGLTALAGIAPLAALNIWLLSDAGFPRVLWLPAAPARDALGDRPADRGPGRLDVWIASAAGQDAEDAAGLACRRSSSPSSWCAGCSCSSSSPIR